MCTQLVLRVQWMLNRHTPMTVYYDGHMELSMDAIIDAAET